MPAPGSSVLGVSLWAPEMGVEDTLKSAGLGLLICPHSGDQVSPFAWD